MEFDVTNIVGILLIVSVAILAAVVIAGFLAARNHMRKSMLNKYEDQ